MDDRRKKKKEEKKSKGKEVAPPKYHCDYCKREITSDVRINCVDCAEFDLCLHCFSVGVEINSHKRDHRYKVVDILDMCLVEEGWTAWEELLMLEGIETCGYGNWRHCSDYVGTKTPREVQAHFEELFLRQPDQCPPLGPPKPEGYSMRAFANRAGDAQIEAAAQATTTKGSGKKSSGGSSKRPSQRKTGKVATPAELAGYYRLRGDFETEWDNDAEQMIMDMQFTPDMDPIERDLSVAMIAIYNDKLAERQRRKDFIFERDLTDFKRVSAEDRRRQKHKFSEQLEQLNVFARYMSKTEHQQLISYLSEEAEIRERIARLQEYRAMGVTTLSEGAVYDESKMRRENAATPSSSRRGASFSEGASRYKRRATLDESGGDLYNTEAMQVPDVTEFPPQIFDHRDRNLLSRHEIKLCAALGLTLDDYFKIKDQAISRCFRDRALTLAAMTEVVAEASGSARAGPSSTQLFQLSRSAVTKLYDFFLANGWVSDDPSKPIGSVGVSRALVLNRGKPMPVV